MPSDCPTPHGKPIPHASGLVPETVETSTGDRSWKIRWAAHLFVTRCRRGSRAAVAARCHKPAQTRWHPWSPVAETSQPGKASLGSGGNWLASRRVWECLGCFWIWILQLNTPNTPEPGEYPLQGTFCWLRVTQPLGYRGHEVEFWPWLDFSTVAWRDRERCQSWNPKGGRQLGPPWESFQEFAWQLGKFNTRNLQSEHCVRPEEKQNRPKQGNISDPSGLVGPEGSRNTYVMGRIHLNLLFGGSLSFFKSLVRRLRDWELQTPIFVWASQTDTRRAEYEEFLVCTGLRPVPSPQYWGLVVVGAPMAGGGGLSIGSSSFWG